MNEKTIDQIECEISDEAVEAAAQVRSLGCGRLFAPAFSAVRCLHSSNEKPRPGGTGALRTEGVGVSGGAFHPTQKSEPLHVDGGSPLALLHSIAKDRRAPLAARPRDRPPRNVPLQSALVSGHERSCGSASVRGQLRTEGHLPSSLAQ